MPLSKCVIALRLLGPTDKLSSKSLSVARDGTRVNAMYLTEASHATGEVLHVDGGAHIGKW